MKRSASLLFALFALLTLRTSAHAQKLDAFMTSVANAWSKGDADALSAMASKQGIALEVDGTHVGDISPRQATAILRRVFDDRQTVKATPGTTRPLPGNNKQAYAELVWERRARGTTESERVKVFFALARENDGWCITEIRMMQ